MIGIIKQKINAITSHGDSRTILARKNVLASFAIKGISIVINLVLVPLTIHYINPERYGIWLTVSSVILWFNFFDMGMGNGLRNRLTEAIAINDKQKARTLISTAYASLLIVAVSIAALFLLINPFIQWHKLFGLPATYAAELHTLTGVLMTMFCAQFVLQLINPINYAFQRPALVSAVFLAGNILSLVFVLVLKSVMPVGSLIWLGIALFSGNLLALLLFTLHFFLFSRRDLAPSFRFLSRGSSKNILSLGSRFFVIQIAAMVQYETTNVLISRWFLASNVTDYNVAYKMFSLIMLVFGVIITPIWSAATDAKSKGDYLWIRNAEKRLLKTWALLSLGGLVLLLFSSQIYELWIRDEKVQVPFLVSFGVMLYMIAMTFGTIYVTILNGLGRLKTQFYLSIITMILFIPISYLLAVKLGLGLFGICLSLIVANVNGLIAAPVEYRKIIREQKSLGNMKAHKITA